MSEMRNFDKTINEFIMTAEEITQLLIDRDIVLIFNESVPGSEHDETLKLLDKGFDWESGEYWVKNEYLPIENTYPEQIIAMTLEEVFEILRDIKNSYDNTETFIFDGSLLSIFAYMLKHESSLTRFSEDTQMPTADKINEIKFGLESAWITSNFPAQDYSCIKEYITDTFMWNEFISAIFHCGHIHEISYYPDNFEMIRYEAPTICMEREADVATIMLSNRRLALLLDSITRDRAKDKRLPQYSEASLNTYFRTETSLFLNPLEIKNIVNRTMR